MAHDHDHSKQPGNIKLAFFLNLGFTVFEFIGGVYVNSVAIIADALHDTGDSLSLGLSWYLDRKSKKSGNQKYTFGYQRFSLLGALINSVILIAGSCFVIYEAARRLIAPEHSDAKGMLVFAIVGVVVNSIAAFRLSKGKSLNEKVLQWHLLEDVLGWAAVLIVSVILLFADIHLLDPLLSLAITAYILWNVIKRLIQTMRIFLQGAPEKLNMEELKAKLTSIPRVASIHHMHTRSLDGEHHVLTAHLKLTRVDSLQEITAIKNKVKDQLREYDLQHVTIEIELDNEECINDIAGEKGD